MGNDAARRSDAPTGASASSRWSSSSRSSGVLAAVAFPNIAQYTKNYRIRGAAQEVAGELQSARSKAIMTNTNSGVSFVVVDRDSYRFVQEDLLGAAAARAAELSPLKHLPQGVEFVVSSTVTNRGPTLRFLRLGGFCNPAVVTSTCLAAVPVANRTTHGGSPRSSTPPPTTGSTSESRAPARSWRSACGKPGPLSSGRCGSRRADECCPSHEEPNHERHES